MWIRPLFFTCPMMQSSLLIQGILKGKYHCTIDLLFDWFGISCVTTDNFCFYLQNRQIQDSQTEGQRYSDTSPCLILWSPLLSFFCYELWLNHSCLTDVSKCILHFLNEERSKFLKSCNYLTKFAFKRKNCKREIWKLSNVFLAKHFMV